MSWQNILKDMGTTEFQVFLSEVFAIPPSESQKLNPSLSLANSIGGGKLLDNMTEEQFMNLMILAEEEDYNGFLKYFETINKNFVKKYKKQSIK